MRTVFHGYQKYENILICQSVGFYVGPFMPSARLPRFLAGFLHATLHMLVLPT